jgi:hypothetical protein
MTDSKSTDPRIPEGTASGDVSREWQAPKLTPLGDAATLTLNVGPLGADDGLIFSAS